LAFSAASFAALAALAAAMRSGAFTDPPLLPSPSWSSGSIGFGGSAVTSPPTRKKRLLRALAMMWALLHSTGWLMVKR
jgi:hypothetical protein